MRARTALLRCALAHAPSRLSARPLPAASDPPALSLRVCPPRNLHPRRYDAKRGAHEILYYVGSHGGAETELACLGCSRLRVVSTTPVPLRWSFACVCGIRFDEQSGCARPRLACRPLPPSLASRPRALGAEPPA